MWSPASGRDELEDELRQLAGRDDSEIDLAETALVLAALDRPQVSRDRYRHHLSLLRRDVAELAEKAGESLEARIGALNDILFGRYEYLGDEDDYDNLQNANLMRVIDRRRGIPVSLGILYIATARAQGWEAHGLNFPGHFMVRIEAGGQRAIVDPYNAGRAREAAELRELLKAVSGSDAELTPELYAPAKNREVLLRLQNNIKLRLIQNDRAEDALQTIEAMLMFAPANYPLWREAGMIHAHMDNLRAAILSLEQFLLLAPEDVARHEAAQLLQTLQRRLN
ncbi:MAG: transglutaminase-like domain-containing protein [Rhodovibrionaceae bacterium]